jgi:hypothetical protein
MASLSERNKSRVRIHLGYFSGAGIPAGDREELEESMDDILDDIQATEIIKVLDTMDSISDLVDPTNPDSYTALQLYAGDINRSRIDKVPAETYKKWWGIYLQYTYRLSQMLFVPNYWAPENQIHRFSRDGGLYKNAVKGTAVPNLGSRLYTQRRFA